MKGKGRHRNGFLALTPEGAWREVCETTDLDFSKLPDTTLDVVEELKGAES